MMWMHTGGAFGGEEGEELCKHLKSSQKELQNATESTTFSY
jgi:hypothetical protein